ncbi:histone methyltransferase set2 [Diatrype stigma]|uniref:Histone-lysine N-methyltransferase, H3 lysine-36 specific n=1 Tax=Diatrype stigma TaxID=117547 RepID=A0AAN9YHZ2_9PEZI
MDEEERVHDALEGLSVNNNNNITISRRIKGENTDSTTTTPNHSSKDLNSRSLTLSPDNNNNKSQSNSISTPEAPSRPRMSRKASQKVAPRPAPLFADLPDVTSDAKEHFEVIENCMYGSKTLGSSKQDALDCDCSEEWRDGTNRACADDSCINRATKMECKKQYANVSVIKTEKKGFGLRANINLHSGDFIFEYIGEVINEPTFRQRMIRYDQEGIKHFYFMSLTKNEFVDATKKGNLGRFCNHSCNPNCYVDKWVVGNKLRMGIFAGREVQAGEELVFNYNVDRYGADPQPCYCGEVNCIGFIGGKTQTERATKLPDATIEALGIDDGDGWDTVVAKKPRKKKVEEDDEEYVNSVQARGLDEQGVTKVMAALMQCKEKWIAVKLLERIQRCDDDRVRSRVVQMHGYQILKTTLATFIEDHNIVLQILDILYQFPRISKNKIVDSEIESTIKPLTKSEHQDVAEESARLLEEWSKLEVAYRIPRKKHDPNAQGTANNSYEERRGNRSEEPLIRTVATLPDNIPKGPRSNVPQRNPNFFNHQRSRRPHAFSNLPPGWFTATDARGSVYFYTKSGQTTWQKPSAPAADPTPAQPTGPSKVQQEQKQLQDIIDSLTKPDAIPRRSASQTPQQATTPTQEPKREKWRSLPIEKQMKIYENTLFPHVKYVMDKFRQRLPKDDLKKFAKDINKKLVASDYKNNRVDDPTTISEKQEKKVKKYVKDFFERAVEKYSQQQKKAAASLATKHEPSAPAIGATPIPDLSTESPSAKIDEDIAMTDDEGTNSTPASTDRKRKRDDGAVGSPGLTPSDTPLIKRLKDEDGDAPPSPPPPPPPPPESTVTPGAEISDQEAALMHENDEAQRIAEAERQKLLEQEAELERENERNMLDFEREQQQNNHAVNGTKGVGVDDVLGSQGDGRSKEEASNALKQNNARGQEVMSH